jgi:hypothetical protein
MAHLRERNKCPGCRGSDAGKPITRIRCKIRKCEKRGKGGGKFCFRCQELPCDTLQRLDKRYRAHYHMSMTENLQDIKKLGVMRFLENERLRWICAACGGTICVHKGSCIACGRTKFPGKRF